MTLVKYYIHMFDYFFDFVAFMNGDLSEAHLFFCDGLQNLSDVSEINFKNVIAKSIVYEKFGIQCKLDEEENEKSRDLKIQSARELVALNVNYGVKLLDYQMTKEQVYYVSDIHLLHKLRYFEAESEDDVAYIIKSFVENIVKESGNTILIGGDVSSNFAIFEMFIKSLRSELDSRRRNPLVIFVLGNHELWEFPQNSFDEIIMKYTHLISDCGMHLLQNSILYKDYEGVAHKITTKELLSLEDKDLRDKIKTSQMTFFGGLAFSGYNEEYNANKGLYRDTIDRATEIEETKKFNELYKKICSILSDKKIIVFTHMPMNCWSKSEDYHKNYIYVSGHTHRAFFSDNGDIRVYADNQIGYKKYDIHMKCFDIEYEYNYFENYDDGIYEITAQEYERFYRSKNIPLNFNRDVNILYMLKKNGYYCFIHKSKGGSFTILNGGSRKKLDIDDINYYYKNMDSVVAFIKKPLDTYTSIQEKIASEIKKIGGSGNIHGCIIDIDWFNHVYVNPTDVKITGYCASDIINKKIYPTVPALLKKDCPALYVRYTKLLKENSQNLCTLEKRGDNDLDLFPQNYFDTDIYTISGEVKKMQKLNANILATWYTVNNQNKMIAD